MLGVSPFALYIPNLNDCCFKANQDWLVVKDRPVQEQDAR
jgi:hypothetical protein